MPSKKNTKMTVNSIDDLIPTAENKQVGEDIYSNHIRVLASVNELFIDFYRMAPPLGNQKLRVAHVQRVLVPISLAKAFIGALNEVVTNYETELSVELEDVRIIAKKAEDGGDDNA